MYFYKFKQHTTMDGFKNIEIKNFRGIEHLIIDDLSRVNVFLGQNNSGKSSILEAIHLLTGMANPDTPQNLNRIRTRNYYSNFKDIFYLFHNMDIKILPEIYAKQIDGDERMLIIKMTYVFDEKFSSNSNGGMNGPLPVSETKTFLNTLEMNFGTHTSGKINKYRSFITVGPDGMVSNKNIAEGYLEKYETAYLTADLWGINLAATLSELFKRKQKDIVLKRLVYFDSRITDVDILQDDIYIDFENMAEKLPLRMTGDGMRRYLNIVAASANPMNNIILIDEIDNGLHYSAYKKLWEAIFTLATDTNKQVFVTTHSKETLYQLNEMLEEHLAYQDALRLYTIEKTKLEGHQAYKMTYNGLREACENGIELRSIVL